MSISGVALHDGTVSSVSAYISSTTVGAIWDLSIQNTTRSITHTDAFTTTFTGLQVISAGVAATFFAAGDSYTVSVNWTNQGGGTNTTYSDNNGNACVWATQDGVSAPGAPGRPSVSVTTQSATSATATVTWTAGTGTIDSYQVQKTYDGVTWNNVGVPVAPTVLTITDVVTQPSLFNSYRVIAINTEAQTVSAASASITLVPIPPPGLNLQISPAAVVVPIPSVAGATSYQVIRNGSSIATITNGANSYTDTGAPLGSALRYQIVALNSVASLTSAASGIFSVGPQPPGAPALALDAFFPSVVDLFWLPVVSVNPCTYAPQRSTNGGTTWTSLAGGIVGTFWQDTSPPAGNLEYRILATDVSAANPNGTTAQGASASITVPLAAPGPLTLALGTSPLGVVASWSAVASATGYTLQKSSDGLKTWAAISINQAGLTFTDTAVAAWQQPAYRVVALGSSGSVTGPACRILVTDGTSPAGLRWILSGVDVSGNVDRSPGRSKVQKRVSRQGNQADFVVFPWNGLGDIFAPVAISLGPQLLFQGWVLDVRETPTGNPAFNEAQIVPQDGYALLNAVLVSDIFEQETAGWIVQNLIARNLPGLTTNNVQAGPLIPYIAFSQQTLDQALVRLISLAASQNAEANFYIDAQMDCHLEFAGSLPLAGVAYSDANPFTNIYP